MKLLRYSCLLLVVLSVNSFAQTLKQVKIERDPNIAINQEYTKEIEKFTTRKEFNSPLTNYLPASKTVPTPKDVLGHIAGAEGYLPYSEDVARYMRAVEKASPRVKVYSIGQVEEGREMIAVAVTSEANMAKLDANRARLAQLGDPRKDQHG